MYKKAITLVVSTVISTSSFAWGEKEQGILQGLFGAWVLNNMIKPQQLEQPYYSPPQYVPNTQYQIYPIVPPTTYYYTPVCQYVPITDHFGRIRYYKQVCR